MKLTEEGSKMLYLCESCLYRDNLTYIWPCSQCTDYDRYEKRGDDVDGR